MNAPIWRAAKLLQITPDAMRRYARSRGYQHQPAVRKWHPSLEAWGDAEGPCLVIPTDQGVGGYEGGVRRFMDALVDLRGDRVVVDVYLDLCELSGIDPRDADPAAGGPA